MKHTLDYYFGNLNMEGGSHVPSEQAEMDLDRSPPPEPPQQIMAVFDTFCIRAYNKWKSQGVLFFTFTIHANVKHNRRYLIKMPLEKQAKYFKLLVKDILNQYDKSTKRISHNYTFYEFTKAGTIHCHGMLYHEDDDVITAYPYYIEELKKSAVKAGLKRVGIKVENVKYFTECRKYISKDWGKHPIVPSYG